MDMVTVQVIEIRPTSPKTTCAPSSQGVRTTVMKNCEPLVSGPMLAIDRRPTWGGKRSEVIHMICNQTHFFSTMSVFCAIYLVMLLDKVLVIEEFSVDGLTTITITAFEVSPLS